MIFTGNLFQYNFKNVGFYGFEHITLVRKFNFATNLNDSNDCWVVHNFAITI